MRGRLCHFSRGSRVGGVAYEGVVRPCAGMQAPLERVLQQLKAVHEKLHLVKGYGEIFRLSAHMNPSRPSRQPNGQEPAREGGA